MITIEQGQAPARSVFIFFFVPADECGEPVLFLQIIFGTDTDLRILFLRFGKNSPPDGACQYVKRPVALLESALIDQKINQVILKHA